MLEWAYPPLMLKSVINSIEIDESLLLKIEQIKYIRHRRKW